MYLLVVVGGMCVSVCACVGRGRERVWVPTNQPTYRPTARLLRPGRCFVLITYGDPGSRLPHLLQPPLDWRAEVRARVDRLLWG